MKALLVVAHGSRQPAANEEVRCLIDEMRHRATGRFDFVSCSYLQFAEPSVAEGIDACIAQGARTVTILPYLLAAGSHVAEDIPGLVATRQKAHPEVLLQIAPHVGQASGMAELVLELATAHSD